MPYSEMGKKIDDSPEPIPQRIFHKAIHILPISSPPIYDGIVVLENGTIIDVGPSEFILQTYNPVQEHSLLVDHGEGVILPCLVNAHTHLELSCLSGKVSPKADFFSWIKELIQARQRCSQEEVEKGILSSIKELLKEGTGLVGDVSNTGSSILPLRKSNLIGRVFIEAIGFCHQKERENQKFIESIVAHTPFEEKDITLSLAAHAPYTVSSRYFQILHNSFMYKDNPFSIHLAESPEEAIFLSQGSEKITSLLMERDAWDPDWVPPRKTPVAYLFQQGILGSRTICVHVVQVSDEDIDILMRTKSHVCLCPRSNHNLGVGLAPVEKFLQKGIPVCLGTDSLNSNTDLSMWQEMMYLKKIVPSIFSAQILKMATLSGAMALGKTDFGSIEVGKHTPLLFVPLINTCGKDIEDALLFEGQGRGVQWIL